MTAAIALRTSGPGDAAEVSALLEASYTALMPDAYESAVIAAALPLIVRANPALLSSGSYYIAADPDGTPIGCGGWTLERPGDGEHAPGLAHIRHFATDPRRTGRGVGRAIFARCAEDAARAGAARFECYSSLNAEGFYAALGFRPLRRMTVPIAAGIDFPCILMTRPV